MREIIFRAKRKDNEEWVEGTYHYSADNKRHYILSRECLLERPENMLCMYGAEISEVIPETVCQYIGMKDKNGKKIFEGNRLSCDDAGVEFTVRWIDDETDFSPSDIRTVIWDGDNDYPAFDLEPPVEGWNGLQYIALNGSCEIVGDIHDEEMK